MCSEFSSRKFLVIFFLVNTPNKPLNIDFAFFYRIPWSTPSSQRSMHCRIHHHPGAEEKYALWPRQQLEEDRDLWDLTTSMRIISSYHYYSVIPYIIIINLTTNIQSYLYWCVYFHLSNNRGGWNKHGERHFLEKNNA